MAGAGGFEFGEFRRLAENMGKLEDSSRRFIEDFLYQMALRALAQTKRRTPVDQGDLREKWFLSDVQWRGGTATVSLQSPVLYASWVEFGHWQQVGRFIPGNWKGDKFVYDPTSKTGMVLKNPWVDGKFMLTLSIEEIERQMPRRLEAAWTQYAAGLLKG